MANEENPRPTLIRNIRPFSLTLKVRVQVSRMWRPRRFQSEIYDGLHYLLIDEMGDTIHARIDESDYPHIANTMQQGGIYDISVFHTQRDRSKCKVANHEVQLCFNESTKFDLVENVVPPIPEYSFHLLEFNELGPQAEHQPLLIDIYGCIKSATPEYQVPIKDTNKMESKLELIVENLRREDLKIFLWGDAARKFNLDSIGASGSAILALITSFRVTKFRQQIQASSTTHSCILINPQIQQTQEYQAEFSKPGDRVKTIPPPTKRLTPEQAKQQTTMTVSQLNALDPDVYTEVYCTASIRRFSMHNGWWYKGCSSCHKQLKKKEDATALSCIDHGTQIPLPWYRVEMKIYDKTNQATVMIMGTEAEQLFEITCENLVNKRFYPKHETVPEEMQKVIDQTCLFLIKVNSYGQLLVTNIFPNHQAAPSSTQAEPNTATPDRLSYQRKRMTEGSSRALFISDSEKRMKSDAQNKHTSTVVSSSTSSFPEKEQYEKKTD
ncbi:uncharacterized protein LOC133721384 isoform X1 [Rosa rugosa]|uniref:uncharacterized protein LOC133721384 isoform X1 n=2 Tax=Rosa rugosa TaxID=74645 RepID=UPI002B40DCB3|nr:uncharacterized protein LOC133721384 isoform X1 [Rosa rugosa]XP_062003963.1 uncharacterized protein LOC133721384 isoform X1 [Rosa rugosa]XP_062003964.1 uncharacterized protein LOC133721384 isoform X1 [Rosa rugosa]XP_062003965.1 uncharacterized protein LOC133721384 isoform X1 [Rosa rugosa]